MLEGAEPVGYVAENTESLRGEVLEVGFCVEMDEVADPACLRVPVADAGADGPVVVRVDL
jgi:hypothetical protein